MADVAPLASRRAFLLGALSSLALASPLGAFGAFGCADRDTTLSRDGTVAAYFPDDGLEAARAIAGRWLAVAAPGATEDDLRRLVAPTQALVDASPDAESAIEALRARVRDDFGSGAIANVDGWTFALTELHLCVLVEIHA